MNGRYLNEWASCDITQSLNADVAYFFQLSILADAVKVEM